MTVLYHEQFAIRNFIDQWNATHIDKTQHIHCATGFKNHCETVELPQALVINFPNSAAVSAFMAMTHKLNHELGRGSDETMVIRPAAGGANVDPNKPSESYSLSGIVDGDIIIRLTGAEFQQLEVVAEEKPEYVQDATKVVRVGANKQQWHTDKELYEKHNLSLATTPLIDTVTAAGGTGTGYHGTSKKHSSVNSLLHAITRCKADGIIERIKRDGTVEQLQADGSFKLMPDKHPHAANMMSTHLGLFGVVLNVEFECEPAYDIEVTMEKRNLAELKKEIRDKNNSLFRQDDFTHFMIVPTYEKDEEFSKDKNIIIFRENKIPRAAKLSAVKIGPNAKIQKMLDKLSDFFCLGSLLDGIPSLIPFFNKYFVTALEIGTKDEKLRGPSYLAQHYLKDYPRKILDTSFLLPDDNECEVMISALDDIYKLFAESKDEEPISKVIFVRRICANHDVGISASSLPVGGKMQNLAAIDLVTDKQIKSFPAFRENIAVRLQNKGAKPHWGKWLPENFTAESYGQGYVNFVQGLLYDACENRAEYERYVCDPSQAEKWSAVLKKVTENPFINKELDGFLKLNKFPAKKLELQLPEEKTHKREFSMTIAQRIKHFINELIEKQPNVSVHPAGQALIQEAQKLANRDHTSVKNNLMLNKVDSRRNSQVMPDDMVVSKVKDFSPPKTCCVIL